MATDEPNQADPIAHFAQLLTLLNAKQCDFLKAFQIHGIVSRAAKASGVSRRSHYGWLATETTYREAFELCRPHICDRIEAGLVHRLINGWLEPVYQGGDLIGHRRRYDNASALKYLERISPKFKPSSEVDISGAVPIQFYLPDNGRNPEKE